VAAPVPCNAPHLQQAGKLGLQHLARPRFAAKDEHPPDTSPPEVHGEKPDGAALVRAPTHRTPVAAASCHHGRGPEIPRYLTATEVLTDLSRAVVRGLLPQVQIMHLCLLYAVKPVIRCGDSFIIEINTSYLSDARFAFS
jgi:hypothetical protein